MILEVHPSRLTGKISVPPSKSHTVRAVFFGMLSVEPCRIENPLDSQDTRAALRAATALGAEVSCGPGAWTLRGVGSVPRFACPELDLANSGTSMRILLGVASLARGGTLRVTGDAQLRTRPAAPLVGALRELGAIIESEPGQDRPPFLLRGGLRGGTTRIEAKTSQYVTSLLMSCPFAAEDSRIEVAALNEAPYLDITFDWLETAGLRMEREGYRRFRISGGQSARAFARRIPADFSSATFFLGAGALDGNDVECIGLDADDSQPDKSVVGYLEEMGADVRCRGDGIRVRSQSLQGVEIDLDQTPDALPMMAVLACFAEGETRLVNVEHARIKETDRIAAMTCELRKMGADVEERQDGMVIRGCRLQGADVDSRADHRIVMALAMAGLHAQGTTRISKAEAVSVTFPEFVDRVRSLGGQVQCRGDA